MHQWLQHIQLCLAMKNFGMHSYMVVVVVRDSRKKTMMSLHGGTIVICEQVECRWSITPSVAHTCCYFWMLKERVIYISVNEGDKARHACSVQWSIKRACVAMTGKILHQQKHISYRQQINNQTNKTTIRKTNKQTNK